MSPPFSAASSSYSIPPVDHVGGLRVPLDTVRCKVAANATGLLRFMVHLSPLELSKTTVTLWFYAIVPPHLGYAMEANSSSQITVSGYIERV